MNNIVKMEELLLLFKGKNGRGIPCSYSDLPTDPNKVIDKIKQEFINDCSFRDRVIEDIIQISHDPKYSWLSLYYLYLIIRIIKVYKLPVDIKNVVSKVEKGIIKFEPKLKLNFDWVGANYKNGLWGDVERLSKNIFEEFGYEIYPKGD